MNWNKNFIPRLDFTKILDFYKTMTENFKFLIIYQLIMNCHQ